MLVFHKMLRSRSNVSIPGGEEIDGAYGSNMDEKELYSALGRWRSSRRRVVKSACVVCGVPMEGIAKKKYCSTRCTMRAFHERQRARVDSPAAPAPPDTPRIMPTGGRSRPREGS